MMGSKPNYNKTIVKINRCPMCMTLITRNNGEKTVYFDWEAQALICRNCGCVLCLAEDSKK